MNVLFLMFALVGIPLFAVIAAVAFWGFYQDDIDLMVVPIEFYRLTEMPALQAIPFFTFAGYLLGKSGAPERLVRVTNAALGWVPGNLALVTLVACALFTAFTGASGVTIIALGALLYPAMKQAHYSERFSLGLITTSGSLGLLFAPSLPLILYAVVAQQLALEQTVSIDDMFLAGIFPGLLMLLVLVLWSAFQARKLPKQQHHEPFWPAIREAAWELPLPIVVLGGIYSGYFAVSEAAAVTAFYVLIVEVLIHKEVKISELSMVTKDAMLLVGGIFMILGVSLASTNLMIDRDVPAQLFNWISSHIETQTTFLVLLLGFLLVLGMILDIFAALILVVPIIYPVGLSFGVHPAHLGVVFLAAMQIGYFTPPVGMNLFIASYRFEKPVWEVYRATLPFFLLLLLSVVLITFIPELSLILL